MQSELPVIGRSILIATIAAGPTLAQFFPPRLDIRVDRIAALDWAKPTLLTEIVLNITNREGGTIIAHIIECSIWDENGKALSNTYTTISNLGPGESVVATANAPFAWNEKFRIRCYPN